jgi:WD40 repeat protein
MYLIGTRNDRIDIWNYESGERVATLSSECGYNYRVFSCSSDGCLLAIAGEPQYVIVWDISIIDDCKELFQLMDVRDEDEHATSICFVNNDNQLVVGTDIAVTLYEAKSGQVLRVVNVSGAIFCQDLGDRIITISWNCTVQEWDHNLTETKQCPLKTRINCAALAPSEDVIAVATVARSVLIVDLVTFDKRVIFESDKLVSSLCFTFRGCRILIALYEDDDKYVVDVMTGVRLFTFQSFGGACYSLDGTCIYGCLTDGTMVCLDAETGSSNPCPFSSYGATSKLFICGRASTILM